MKLTDIIPQVDGGTRYLVTTPRGTLGVDVWRNGRIEVIRCTDATGTTQRDIREARALVQSAAYRSEN
jgi:hypothetical protein